LANRSLHDPFIDGAHLGDVVGGDHTRNTPSNLLRMIDPLRPPRQEEEREAEV
jgi:hypothetical protein